jgi:hypothetical protein
MTGTRASAVTALRLSATAFAPVLSTDPARSARSPAVGMSYTEEDWVDDEATSRRGPDE